MPQFLSAEWVAGFNIALDGVELGSDGTEGSLVAAAGRFCVRQVVSDVPPDARTVQTTLVVDGGTATLVLDDPDATDPELRPDVIVALPYQLAVAISRGELHPTQALGTGEIRVRGDLAVLVAGQAVLGGAAAHLHDLQAATTY
ncbi:MAG TPA: SCP2 sterol-binding domain-containing protein [Acidimicrobiales bacterium]|nr:SCP2 sterol-binding domain-containing protein [Acidimicrobiales bacterium]